MTPKPNHQGEGGGRPRKFPSVQDFESQAEGYFVSLEPEDAEHFPKPATLSGLCLYLDTFPDVLSDYESGKYDDDDNKFSAAVKKARLRVVNYAETALYTARNAAGPIFHLTNLTRKYTGDEQFKNAQHNEVTGPNGGAVVLKLLKADEDL